MESGSSAIRARKKYRRPGWCLWVLGFIFSLVVFSRADSAAGAIYVFVDENGVRHFTNVPSDSRYRLNVTPGSEHRRLLVNRFSKHINEAAYRYQIDPLLIKAIVKVESDFNQYAVSHKGALGLMQLMPDTIQDMKVLNPFDPGDNISGGTRFLKKNLMRFDGDLELSLAAYNAGPEKVLAENRVPDFPETQNFIKRVLEQYRRYQAVGAWSY
jgi:soluble lytic murein transglycosylase-like protein